MQESGKSVSAGFLGGQYDTLLLSVIASGHYYGYSMYKAITDITEHRFEIKEATLYSGLRRLEAEGLITSFWGDETQGGRRKYYAITETGRTRIDENISKWHVTRHVMEKIIAITKKGETNG